MNRQKYRIFIQDVGKNGYSGYADTQATSRREAESQYSHAPARIVALPHNRRDLWPDGKTGRLPKSPAQLRGERL